MFELPILNVNNKFSNILHSANVAEKIKWRQMMNLIPIDEIAASTAVNGVTTPQFLYRQADASVIISWTLSHFGLRIIPYALYDMAELSGLLKKKHPYQDTIIKVIECAVILSASIGVGKIQSIIQGDTNWEKNAVVLFASHYTAIGLTALGKKIWGYYSSSGQKRDDIAARDS